MRFMFWNVRGCNKPYKQKEIRIYLQRNKVDVAVLVETRVKQENSKKIVGKICRGWEFVNNYSTAVNGRIWVCWNPKMVQVTLLRQHEQAIVCQVLDIHSGRVQQVMAIYALNTTEQRKDLWKFIEDVLGNGAEATLLGGDFNAILRAEDRYQLILLQMLILLTSRTACNKWN